MRLPLCVLLRWLRVEVSTLAGAFTKLITMLDVRPNSVPETTGAFTKLITMLDVRPNSVPETNGLPGARPAVLITKRGKAIESRHVVVYHHVLRDAQQALRVLERDNWCFVQPTAASAVLDSLGVQA